MKIRRALPRGCALLLGCLVAATTLMGQGLAFRRFDSKDGIPQSQITALLEDRDGFIWMGTQDSVARLGPSGVRVLGAAQGMKLNQVGCLMQDRTGAIWAGGVEMGVAEIRGSQVRCYGQEQGLLRPEVYSLAEGARGEIFVGTRLGLFVKEPGAEGFREVPLPDDWRHSAIYAMAVDPSGGLWMGSRQGRVGLWDGKRVELALMPSSFSRSAVLAFQRDPKGILWALLNRGLARRKADGGWEQVSLPGIQDAASFYHFTINAQGEMLIAMQSDGIYQRMPDGRGRIYTRRDGLPRDAIQAVLRDRHGVLWAGSNGDYLAALAVPQLRVLQADPLTGANLGLGAVMRFHELAPGRVLMCSNGGLFLWEEGKGITRRWTQREGLPSEDCWSLAPARGGGVWVGSTKGLALWREGRITPGPKEMASDQVVDILETAGRLWAGGDAGISELTPEGRFIRTYQAPQEVGTTGISSLIPWQDGLLVGTRLGLYHFRGGRYNRIFADSPVAQAMVGVLHASPEGGFWVGTQGALFRYTPAGGWRRMDEELGLTESAVNFIAELPGGTLALGHNKGLLLARPDGGVTLTRNQGLISDETNQMGALVDARGRLWVGMNGGVCILEAGDALQAPRLPAPRIVEAIWGKGSAWLPTGLELPPLPGNLTLTVDTGMPLAPNPPRYQVFIEGLDQGWRNLEEGISAIQIAQLSYGTYRFHLRVSLDGRAWTEAAPFTIVVGRAWYQTWAMRVLFILGGLGLLVQAVKRRLRSLEARARALEARVDERTEELALRNRALERLHHQLKRNLEIRIQLMNTVTHDLRSPLTSILITVDRLQTLREGADKRTASTLDILEREARRLEGLLKGMLDQSRAESFTDSLNQRLCHPAEILQGMTDTLKLKAESRELGSRVELAPACEQVWVLVDVAAMQQVLFNLVENALKFTPSPGTVGIRALVREQSWVLEVWDTGRGIPEEKLATIFQAFQQADDKDVRTGWGLGLSICRTMVEAHQGRIDVESRPGQGSTFRVELPLVVAKPS